MRTLNYVWRKLWSDCLSERDIKVFGFDTPVVEELVSLVRSIDLEVDDGTINDLA